MKTVEYGQNNNEVVILLHGGGLSWWNYEEAAVHLSSRYHVVLPILNGHAGSDAPFTTIREQANAIIAMIDERFSGQVLLIGGVSLGGQVLTEMLSVRGDICRFAVIESALAIPMPFTSALIEPVYAICYPLIGMRWFSRWQFAALHIRGELFERYYADSAAITKENLIAFMRENARCSISDTLAKCTAKTLVAVGEREIAIMKRSAKRIAEMLTDARLTVMHGLHHGEWSINHGRQYADALMQWIDGKGIVDN